jgi:predicted CXXCH cytochrome family protein
MIRVAPATILRSMIGGPLLIGAWLLLAAIPVAADGGPHVSGDNSGISSLTADGCAGCHRAHTAQGEMLLNATSGEELCFTCHGAASTGATTDVMTGVQYAIGAGGLRGTTQLGALRGGGFDQARLVSSSAARTWRSSPSTIWAKVTVGAAADVTSSHLNLATNGLTAPTVAWGNNGYGSGVGATVSLGCASCHNPHGNGKYRILNPIPAPTATISGTFVPVAAPGATVTDAALPAAGDARNYTVIQVKPAAGGTYMLLASDVQDAFKISDGNPATNPTKTWPAGTYNSSAGDYWHVRVPWNSASGTADAPNGLPGGPTAFTTQMEAWCSACHTRYHATQGSPVNPSGDPLFQYRHQTDGSAATCTTCHVSHGSNAGMGGTFSATFPYPDNVYSAGPPPTNSSVSASSRLLKVDNRGTCQLCHDPTNTVNSGDYTGPRTVPGVP